MPYASLDNLSRFHGRMRGRASAEFASLDMANWQKTAAAGAVSFSPVPEMPIDPVVNFLFTESGPASGTKGPENPSTISGVSSVKATRCGKNIIKYPFYQTTRTVNGVTWTDNGDGTVTANGTASETSSFHLVNPYWNPNGGILLLPGTYHLSGCPAGGYWNTYNLRVITSANNTNSGYITAPSDTGSGSNIVVTKASIVSYSLNVTSGTIVSNLVFRPQLELGSTATAFEPYSGANYTIPLNGTYYGGSVDLSTGVMTVTRGEYVFTGNENWSLNVLSDSINSFKADILPVGTFANGISASTRACSHFPLDNAASPAVNTFTTLGSSNARVFFRVPASTYPDVASFKSWLASEYASDHPVVFAYLRNHPFTVSLTPLKIYSLSQADPYTPRLNTVYSDQVSVQVGYPKSPQASQTELANAIVSLGGNV